MNQQLANRIRGHAEVCLDLVGMLQSQFEALITFADILDEGQALVVNSKAFDHLSRL